MAANRNWFLMNSDFMANNYIPTSGEKLRVFGLFGGGASSLIGLADGNKHKETYELVGAGTNNPDASGVIELRERGIDELEFLDYAHFCQERDLDPKKKDSNRQYHEEWLRKVEPFSPHIIALSGYFKIVPPEFLEEHPMTWNVHPAPLHYLTPKQRKGVTRVPYDSLIDAGNIHPGEVEILMKENSLMRAFRGETGVFDVLVFGHEHGVSDLRSTIHIATKDVDSGPILVESAALPIDMERSGRMIRNRNWDALMKYREELQSQLKNDGDVPAFRSAVELFAEGRLSYSDGIVAVDDNEQPYHGYQLAGV